MTSFTVRLSAARAHECRVGRELEQRGWEVTPWGQGILPPGTCRALAACGSRFRHFPDLVAARGGQAAAVDAKDGACSAVSGRYAVSRGCVSFGLQFTAAFDLPVYYVFGNLTVLSPAEVMACGAARRGEPGNGSYYLVPGHAGRDFDEIFGRPST